MLVKIKTVDEKTTGGILLPSTAQTKPQGGEVVAVGEGKTIGKSKVGISIQVNIVLEGEKQCTHLLDKLKTHVNYACWGKSLLSSVMVYLLDG